MEKKKSYIQTNDAWLRNNVITTIVTAVICISAILLASFNIIPHILLASLIPVVCFFYRMLRKDFESHRNYNREIKFIDEYNTYRKSFSRELNQKEFEMFENFVTKQTPKMNVEKPAKAKVPVKKTSFLKKIAASFAWYIA